jgi:hypothetical protein
MIETLLALSFACVDPSDALSRPRLQNEPCKLPMYEAVQLKSSPGEQTRLPTFQRRGPAEDSGHEFFWRLPSPGYRPHGVPGVGNWRGGR